MVVVVLFDNPGHLHDRAGNLHDKPCNLHYKVWMCMTSRGILHDNPGYLHDNPRNLHDNVCNFTGGLRVSRRSWELALPPIQVYGRSCNRPGGCATTWTLALQQRSSPET